MKLMYNSRYIVYAALQGRRQPSGRQPPVVKARFAVPQSPAPKTPVRLAIRKSFFNIGPVIQDTEPDNCSDPQYKQPGMPAAVVYFLANVRWLIGTILTNEKVCQCQRMALNQERNQ